MKSETPVEVMLALTVTENPNMFTTFSYGNNLGLDWTTNADQHVSTWWVLRITVRIRM